MRTTLANALAWIGGSIAAGLALVPFASPAHWGPAEPTYALVLDYRTDRHVIDHGLTASECGSALPNGDHLKHVAFTCEQEG